MKWKKSLLSVQRCLISGGFYKVVAMWFRHIVWTADMCLRCFKAGGRKLSTCCPVSASSSVNLCQCRNCCSSSVSTCTSVPLQTHAIHSWTPPPSSPLPLPYKFPFVNKLIKISALPIATVRFHGLTFHTKEDIFSQAPWSLVSTWII